MGDNAGKSWEWHNTEVGQGYQARGVIRQRSAVAEVSIVDLSKPQNVSDQNDKSEKSNKKEVDHRSKDKKDKKAHKSSSSKTKVKKEKREKPSFNPLLQLLATRLSDKTMSFS